MGKVKKIRKISSGYLSNTDSWIFLPVSVQYSISSDGKNYELIKEMGHDINERDTKSFIHNFKTEPLKVSGRYIHVQAINIKTCPDWHKGAGDKAWLFVDEIIVE